MKKLWKHDLKSKSEIITEALIQVQDAGYRLELSEIALYAVLRVNYDGLESYNRLAFSNSDYGGIANLWFVTRKGIPLIDGAAKIDVAVYLFEDGGRSDLICHFDVEIRDGEMVPF